MANRAADGLEEQLELILTRAPTRLRPERGIADRLMTVLPMLVLSGAWVGIGYGVAHFTGAICAAAFGLLTSIALQVFVSRLRIG